MSKKPQKSEPIRAVYLTATDKPAEIRKKFDAKLGGSDSGVYTIQVHFSGSNLEMPEITKILTVLDKYYLVTGLKRISKRSMDLTLHVI